MNLRRLKYFLKIVDVGSLTQAADLLHIAQPALSQQPATLEGEVRQQLLLRTKRGVTPTEAGKVLHRHAQLILRQGDGLGATITPTSMARELVIACDAWQSRIVEPEIDDKALAQQKKEELQMEEIRQGRWERSFVEALEARAIN